MKIKSLTPVVIKTSGWLHERFGNHVAQISVDTTLKLKSAVKDVSRARRGMVPPELEFWTKKFIMPPQGVNDIDHVLGYDTDEGHVQGSIEYDEVLREYARKYPDDWAIVQKSLGLARQKSRHACFPGGEPIYLSCGEMREIQKVDGQEVLTGTGAKAMARLLDQGVREVVEYVLEDGRTIRCTPDHRVMTECGWMKIGQAMAAGADLVLANAAATGSAGKQRPTRNRRAGGSLTGPGGRLTTPPGSAPRVTGGSDHGPHSKRRATGASAASTTHGSSTRHRKTSAPSGCATSTAITTRRRVGSLILNSPTSSSAYGPVACIAQGPQPDSTDSTTSAATPATTSFRAAGAAIEYGATT